MGKTIWEPPHFQHSCYTDMAVDVWMLLLNRVDHIHTTVQLELLNTPVPRVQWPETEMINTNYTASDEPSINPHIEDGPTD